MLEGAAVLGLRVSIRTPLLRPHALTGHRVIAGMGSRRDPKNLPAMLPSVPPSPCCYMDAVEIAVCILKGFYIKYVWLV